ncbi:MAG: hypothetical protein DRM98_04195 [Thermoplasmata archaeon]|nr:MAG: hypothetical protein DRM98_04195 [Thermoplasmata archaeon]
MNLNLEKPCKKSAFAVDFVDSNSGTKNQQSEKRFQELNLQNHSCANSATAPQDVNNIGN